MKNDKSGVFGLVGLLNGPQTMGRSPVFWIGFAIFVVLAYLGPTHLG